MKWITLLCLQLCFSSLMAQSPPSIEIKGEVTFVSNAPLEFITAKSAKLNGLLNLQSKSFAFQMQVETFKGFNSPLQQEHFYENYMRTHIYPKATYAGKIIDDFDWSKNGQYKVRAKGILTIHGESKERIITNTITVKNGTVSIESVFEVPLSDHGIKIPKIVEQKISTIIQVTVNASGTL